MALESVTPWLVAAVPAAGHDVWGALLFGGQLFLPRLRQHYRVTPCQHTPVPGMLVGGADTVDRISTHWAVPPRSRPGAPQQPACRVHG